MKDLINIKSDDVKELTIYNLLNQGITNKVYENYMHHILDCANNGLTYTKMSIWEFYVDGSYSGNDLYVVKNNVLKILQLREFNVDVSSGYVNWSK